MVACMHVYTVRIYVILCVYACMYVQCWHLIPALNAWSARVQYTTPVSLSMHAWMTSHLNVALTRKLRGSVMSLVFMLSMGICTTRYWQTSGRLMQELKVCTVCMDGWMDGWMSARCHHARYLAVYIVDSLIMCLRRNFGRKLLLHIHLPFQKLSSLS